MAIATNPTTGEVVYLDEAGAWQPAQTSVNPDTKEMLAFDGRDWTPVPASKGVFTYIDDAVRSVASGITFGWADEIAAKMNELTGVGGTYDENIKKERARDAQIPVQIQLPAEIAGAIGTTVLTMPLAGLKAIAAASSRLPAWFRFGTLGGAEGALAGAGGAEEGTRGTGALKGAAIGAPIGAAAPSVIRGVENTVSAVRGAFSPSAGAAADIGRAIVRDETTPAEIVAKVTAAQADRPGTATIADVGGENVRGLVERVAQTPGAGRTKVVPALTGRQEAQAARVSDDLTTLTGTNKTAREAVEDTIAERSTAAAPLYDEAFNFNARTVPEIVQAFENATATGFGKAVLNSGTLKKSLQTEYGIENVADAPLMVLIDAWKKTADDLVGAAVRKGEGNTARVISRMRDGVVKVVDKFNSKYAEARNAWAGPSAYLDAVEGGKNILSPKLSGEELAAAFAKLTDSQKEAYRIGAVSSIIARVGNDPAKLADVTKYLRSDQMRQKVAAIMPTDEAKQAWARRLDFEVAASELTARSLGNSATARRLAERDDAKGVVGDLVLDALTAGPASVSVLRRVLTAGPRWVRDTVRSRTDAELADLLTNPARMQDLPGVVQRASQMRRVTNSGAPRGTASSVAGSVATTTE